MLRIGLFYCAAPLSGAFGGLLATGLAQINYHGYKCKATDICSGEESANDGLSMAVDFRG